MPHIDSILTKWAYRGGDVFYEKANVLALVDQLEAKVQSEGSFTLEGADRYGNGAELRAAIEILQTKGYEVEATEEGFYHRIASIRVGPAGPQMQSSQTP